MLGWKNSGNFAVSLRGALCIVPPHRISWSVSRNKCSWQTSGDLLVDLAFRLIISAEYASCWHCFSQIIRAWWCSDGVNGPVTLSCKDFLQLSINLYTYALTAKSLCSLLYVYLAMSTIQLMRIVPDGCWLSDGVKLVVVMASACISMLDGKFQVGQLFLEGSHWGLCLHNVDNLGWDEEMPLLRRSAGLS